MTLSVVIITKNEAANIGRCLRAVSFADERIVYDTGSTDETREIAAAAGARVIVGRFDGFGPTKRQALELAGCEWVLSLDADEEVTAPLAASIQSAIRLQEIDGYSLCRRTLFLGRWLSHGGWYPDRVLRLARRTAFRMSDAVVHEGMTVAGRTAALSGDLLHYSYPDLESYFRKGDFYTSLAAGQADNSRPVGAYGLMVRPCWKIFLQYVLRGGFLDGWQGYVLAILSGMQVMTKYAKIRIRQERAQGGQDE